MSAFGQPPTPDSSASPPSRSSEAEEAITPGKPLWEHRPWYRELNNYQWFVLIVATLAWMFDTMDQQFFNLARNPAMVDLLKVEPTDPAVKNAGSIATTIFMLGWGIGGLIFGVMGDRYGRAKTLVITVTTYSLFTGLSALSIGFWDFVFYRFLTGMGVGGAFAAGATLIAEVMPDRARTPALGFFQAFSAVGNIIAATTTIFLGYLKATGTIEAVPWRLMFLVGALPAFLAFFVMRRLEEPQRWKDAVAARKAHDGLPDTSRAGSYADLFGNPEWRRNAIVGFVLAFAGVVGVWGIGFFTFDLFRYVFRDQFQAYGVQLGLEGKTLTNYVDGTLTYWTGIVSFMQNMGAFFGIYAFARMTHFFGRRQCFALFFILALFATAGTYWFLSELWHVFVLIPIMGFCQLALFGGYSIYLPELFPTHLRSTGISFCYNVGRLFAAVGTLNLGFLSTKVFHDFGPGADMPFRLAGITMCSVFLVGLCALPFAPETRGKPLPEAPKR